MGIFREPWLIILIVVLVLLLFAAPKLPAFAKSLGQSMRIFRKEVKTMKDEKAAEATPGKTDDAAPDDRDPDSTRPSA
ncbi:MAG TPA: twin-arginine translocase TatA/TatE family subunit [Microbacteriaceae bacterium]|nr:twin-arginine translocase TatA/TatE family subunit [Microbacteriaceae bacterium]